MCSQCFTNSTKLFTFGDLTVHISNKTYGKWERGSYGIISSNDPHIYFKTNPIIDHSFDYTEDQENDMNDNDTLLWNNFHFMSKKISEEIGKLYPETAFNLIKNLVEHGYDENKNGCWYHYFTHHLAKSILEKELKYETNILELYDHIPILFPEFFKTHENYKGIEFHDEYLLVRGYDEMDGELEFKVKHKNILNRIRKYKKNVQKII